MIFIIILHCLSVYMHFYFVASISTGFKNQAGILHMLMCIKQTLDRKTKENTTEI